MPSVAVLRAVVALVLAACCACSPSVGAPAAEEVRYVIDQDDGTPIPGAIVVATWRGTFGIHGAQACNRIESYVSGADGSFRTPNDSKFGTVIVGAYKKGYERGNSPKSAQAATDGNYRHAQVYHYRWNETNTRGEIVSVEPKIYKSKEQALQVSRENLDAFLRKSSKDRAGRLEELHRMQIEGSCGGVTLSTAGAIPFFKAIYEEQVELGDSPNELESTMRYIRMAVPRK